MELSAKQKRQITRYIIGLLLLLIADRWMNGTMLTQLRPAFIVSRMDVFTWVFFSTGIPNWLINNQQGWLLFDLLFSILPFVYLAAFTWKRSWAAPLAWLWLIFNWTYVQSYTSYSTNSIEAHLAWLLLPLLFTTTTPQGFYLVFRFMRFFFLWFLVSAGLWKLWQHGIFNPDQMSGILFMQHKEYLATSPHTPLARFYYWLVDHQQFGYGLYVGAAILELCFAVGFVTRRFDWLLIVLYFSFFIMDVLIMRIQYWEMAPFVITLCYSSQVIPAKYPGRKLARA